MRHLVGWIVTTLLIGIISMMVFEMLERGGIYAAVVPWVVVASVGLIFFVAARPTPARKSARDLLELVIEVRQVRGFGRPEGVVTGDVVRMMKSFHSHSDVSRVLTLRDQVENSSTVTRYMRMFGEGAR